MLDSIHLFSLVGSCIMYGLMFSACLLGVSGLSNLIKERPYGQLSTQTLLIVINIIFLIGFIWVCWFHFQINRLLPLELPANMYEWLNSQLSIQNRKAAYGLPLYDPANPPRYAIPVWIENEKYYFWFMCYSIMALIAHFKIKNHRMRGLVHLILCIQVFILFFAVDPFKQPLPMFFDQIRPWFETTRQPMSQMGQFMRLYPKMVFYYNAHYMWFHPPMLFISYACITITFITSVFMLVDRDPEIELLGYEFAKLGYFMLTLGMLMGYPWALQAWGPNWWWDPKICSSIMMWAIFSTYLHTRIYVGRAGMWYFSSILGIICFVSMIFTFLTSFFFPGEHTFQ
jgi:hypothetical protein